MRFKGLDLNLLVAFEALVDLRNVSRAAERLMLSQPAASAALSRLRDYFEDPLLTTAGKRMYVTPFAEAILPQVRAVLLAADTVVSASGFFDPASSSRTFRIIGSDYIVTAVLAGLAQQFATSAPNIKFDFVLPDDVAIKALDRGEIDLFLSPPEYISEKHPAVLLYDEYHLVVGCRDNPIFRNPLTSDAFFEAGHVAVALGSHRTKGFAERQLDKMGRTRRIDATSSSFAMIPWLVMKTHRLALMHARLANAMAPHFPIALAPLPFDFPTMPEMAQFHETRSSDEGLKWLIGEMRDYALGQVAPPNHK